MVKTPRNIHSKSSKKPVTIDLEPEAVSGSDKPAGSPSDTAGKDAKAKTPEPSKEHTSGASSAGAAGASGRTPKSETAAKPKSSIAALVIAGIVGGGVALGGYAFLSASGIVGSGAPPPDMTPITSALDDMKSRLQSVEQSIDGRALEAARSEVESVRTDIEGRFTESAAEIEALKDNLAQLRTALEDGQGGEGAQVNALRERLDSIEQQLKSISELTADGGIDPAAWSEALARLDAVETSGQEQQSSLAMLGDGVSANQAALTELSAAIAALSERIDQQGGNPEVARAIAAAALKSAIDRGLPFMAELETYASVAPDSPDIAALRELAAGGVPTRSQIADRMDAMANAMIAAAGGVDENAGFFQQLLSSAQSLVQVRPIGMVEGETPAAIVARMEVAIDRNDYTAALAEFDMLPDASQAAGRAFADMISARQKVDDLIDNALAAALAPNSQ